ncbi:SDR family NAD(P)-dependent oxidoreductase [Microbacterium murale]|uniref:NAD(P)-dependent dehydrogenase (Short-subunit alcohol dehydrogenase family) n=1 Tax=Microbacterium murale TaxID=1081040 RepID=A0ABU0PCD0_9MICO|nr:SDR family oxidoreductase [Microbacterium murale]MDQ0644259.1 NAD(P)-dependent dehydrogenase (short-subunit alcohol dehydrogenase family) [Microbacterium murale]
MSEETWPVPVGDSLATAAAPWLEGKVALVAGGGLSGPEGGVGFAFAWLCARSGARVAVLDRDPLAGERTVAALRDIGGTAKFFEVDVTDDASVKSAVDAAAAHFGRIDVVADSIGGGGTQPMFDATPDEFERGMMLNFTAVWFVIRHAQRHMERGGAVVTISSGAAEGRGPGMPYSFAKTALEKMSIGAAASLAPRGIRVNCVRVGMIWGAFAARGLTEEQRRLRADNVALKTEGNNWDIASAAFFLVTEQARWITGQVVSVDGGGFAMKNMGQAGSAKK